MEELYSTDVAVLATLRKDVLVAEAKLRFLPSSGLKNELALVIATDNTARTANGTLELLRERHTATDAMDQGTTPASPQSSSVPLPQSWGDLVRLVQALQVTPQPATVQIFSSHDAVRAIPMFSGDPKDSVADWISTVNRVQSSARWTPELTVLNASTRLVDQALNWHKVQGQCYPEWPAWSAALSSRFSYQMSYSEFVAYNSERKLLPTETLATYIFEKNVMLRKAPFVLSSKDRVLMILEDVDDPACAYALATPQCTDVDELLDRAHVVDKLRKLSTVAPQPATPKVTSDSDRSRDSAQRADTSEPSPTEPRYNANPKYNPYRDNPQDMVCFRCGNIGHVSYNCTSTPAPPGKKPLLMPASSSTTSTDPSSAQPPPPKATSAPAPAPKPSVNCVAPSALHSLCLLPVTIDNSVVVDALPDSGSQITIIRSSLVPSTVKIHPWIGSDFQVAGGTVKPSGWFSAELRIGKVCHVMPRIVIADPLPVAMLLGKDWQFEIQARIIHEPNGAVCIMTPTTVDVYQCISSSVTMIGCVVSSQMFTRQVHALDQPDEKVNLVATIAYNNPTRCTPHHVVQHDPLCHHDHVEELVDMGTCSSSTSPPAAPALVVDQTFHADTAPCSALPVMLDADQGAAFDELDIAWTTPPLAFVRDTPPRFGAACPCNGLGACFSEIAVPVQRKPPPDPPPVPDPKTPVPRYPRRLRRLPGSFCGTVFLEDRFVVKPYLN